MEIGLVGLGRMGGNMRERLRRAGHTVIGYDRNQEISDSTSLEDMVGKLPSPRVVWVMVPSGDITRDTIAALGELLGEGDVVIDGGNSRWTDDKVHAAQLGETGIGFVDAGVSGGEVTLEAGTGDEAQASESLDSTLTGDDISIAFNPTYLLDGLGALDTAYAELRFTASTRPAVLAGKDAADAKAGDDYRYLLMPVRLSG